MTMLIQIEDKIENYMLVVVSDECVRAEIEALVNTGCYMEARNLAFSEGEVLRLITEFEKPFVEVDLIISLKNAHRDLTTAR